MHIVHFENSRLLVSRISLVVFLCNRRRIDILLALSAFKMAGSSSNQNPVPPTAAEKRNLVEHLTAKEKMIDRSRDKFIAMGIWLWVKVNFTIEEMQEYLDMIEEVQYTERHLMLKYGGKFHRISNIELAKKMGMTVRMPKDWESLDLPTEPLEIKTLSDALNLEEMEAKLAKFKSQEHITYEEISDQQDRCYYYHLAKRILGYVHYHHVNKIQDTSYNCNWIAEEDLVPIADL